LAFDAPVPDDGHDAFEEILAHVLEHIGRGDVRTVGDHRNASATKAQLMQLFQTQLVVRDRRRQQEQNLRLRRAYLLDQLRAVRQRGREGFVDQELEPERCRPPSRIGLAKATDAAVLS